MPFARRVAPGETIRLADIDTRQDSGLEKEVGKERAEILGRELDDLEDLLCFAKTHSLLIVLQAMDAGGKDGAIRHILRSSNIVSSRVASFKVPTEEELGHDFLWRVHKQAPRRGEIVLFNRSHYEDVLVVKVHGYDTPDRIEPRYDHINAFEKLLAEQANTIILKFYLHVSKEEQEERLREREEDARAYWKLSAGDWKERDHWEDYQRAFEEAIMRTSTDYAPWHIVPADRKWHRNVCLSKAIVEALRPYKETWEQKLEEMGATAKAELEAFRKDQSL